MNKITVPFGQLLSLVDEYIETFEDNNVPPSIAADVPITIEVTEDSVVASVSVPVPREGGGRRVQQ